VLGVVVLTLIVNIFRDKKIGYKSVFVMVSWSIDDTLPVKFDKMPVSCIVMIYI